MQFEFQPGTSDWRALEQRPSKRAIYWRAWWSNVALVALLFVGAGAFGAAGMQLENRSLVIGAIANTVFVGFLALLIIQRWRHRFDLLAEVPRQRVVLDDSGIGMESDRGWSFYTWPEATDVEQGPQHLFVDLRNDTTVVLPWQALGEEPEHAVEWIESYRRSASSEGVPAFVRERLAVLAADGRPTATIACRMNASDSQRYIVQSQTQLKKASEQLSAPTRWFRALGNFAALFVILVSLSVLNVLAGEPFLFLPALFELVGPVLVSVGILLLWA